jgi:hypothetical protein
MGLRKDFADVHLARNLALPANDQGVIFRHRGAQRVGCAYFHQPSSWRGGLLISSSIHCRRTHYGEVYNSHMCDAKLSILDFAPNTRSNKEHTRLCRRLFDWKTHTNINVYLYFISLLSFVCFLREFFSLPVCDVSLLKIWRPVKPSFEFSYTRKISLQPQK